MERYAWKAVIRDGMREEYIRRHNEGFWPEMTGALNEAGIHNYSIWVLGNELFGYFECAEGVQYALKKQAESETVNKWSRYMEDVLIREIDPVSGDRGMTQTFFHR